MRKVDGFRPAFITFVPDEKQDSHRRITLLQLVRTHGRAFCSRCPRKRQMEGTEAVFAARPPLCRGPACRHGMDRDLLVCLLRLDLLNG